MPYEQSLIKAWKGVINDKRQQFIKRGSNERKIVAHLYHHLLKCGVNAKDIEMEKKMKKTRCDLVLGNKIWVEVKDYYGSQKPSEHLRRQISEMKKKSERDGSCFVLVLLHDKDRKDTRRAIERFKKKGAIIYINDEPI